MYWDTPYSVDLLLLEYPLSVIRHLSSVLKKKENKETKPCKEKKRTRILGFHCDGNQKTKKGRLLLCLPFWRSTVPGVVRSKIFPFGFHSFPFAV
jgi:hypothetical protein